MEDKPRTDIPANFSREVFNMLDDLDQHLYFRWDLTNDCVSLHEPLPHRFRELPVYLPQASTQFWTERLIHPEDRPILHAPRRKDDHRAHAQGEREAPRAPSSRQLSLG